MKSVMEKAASIGKALRFVNAVTPGKAAFSLPKKRRSSSVDMGNPG
jgi:hypothetical protein